MTCQLAAVLVCLFSLTFSIPVQIGILGSNSNEILRLNGLTLTNLGFGQAQVQASPFLPQYVLQQQAELARTPQLVNFNPQLTGPFGPMGPPMLFPAQGNQLTPQIFPNAQQEPQPGTPQDPNSPHQTHNTQQQMVPQYYPSFAYPQPPRVQGYPYYQYTPYGYPQMRNSPSVMQPTINNGQGQQNPEKTTQNPQLPLQQAIKPPGQGERTWPKDRPTETSPLPPDHRGDTADPGIDEGRPNFPFIFEP
ncbi:proline-rich proteoglycan 2 isoform X1 [Osmerus eperlanus]|uniref:proline-rich proteoglycan 2 isoform X1 n=1 Tax=Osmerus eperlanus TaxID=29151 RepID=UPI002E14AB35